MLVMRGGALMLTALAVLASWPRNVGAQAAAVRLQRPDASLTFEFTTIRSVRELSDGRVLIASLGEPRLAIADLRTGQTRQIGREGAGPGEYRDVSRVHALGGDSSLVEDRRSQRWLFLRGDQFIATVHAPRHATNYVRIAGIDRQGRLLELRAASYGRSTEAPVMRVIINADSLSVLVHRRSREAFTEIVPAPPALTVIRGAWRGLRVGSRVSPLGGEMLYELRNPCSVGDQAVLFRDGWIAVAYADPYRIEWYDPEHERVRVVPVHHDPIRVDERQKAFAVRVYSSTLFRSGFKPEELPNWPQYLPPFPQDALIAAPDGRVLIGRTRSADTPNDRVYDIVGRNGSVTLRLRMAANERIVGAGARSIYVAVADEDGLEMLRRHPWP